MVIKEVNFGDIMKIINRMKNMKSSGISGINMQMLKLSKDSVTPKLCNIFNNMHKKQIYPNAWKKQK